MDRDLDLEARLLLGKPILVKKVGFLYPLTINQVIDMGINNYYSLISLLLSDEEEIKNKTKYKSSIEYLTNLCLQSEETRNYILGFLALLFRENASVHTLGFFYLGELTQNRIVDESNFQEIQEIIKHQNCIKREENKSEKVKEFEKRLAEMRKKYGKDNETTLIEVISAVASKHPSINLLKMGDSTIYQIYDYMARLNLIESYSFNVMAMINGASVDSDLENKHWSSRINKNN